MEHDITQEHLDTLLLVDEMTKSGWTTASGWKDLASYLIKKGISEPKTTIIFDSFVFLEKKGYVDNGIEDYDQGITGLSSVSLTEKGKRILSELNLNESREGRAVVRSRDSSTCWVADAFGKPGGGRLDVDAVQASAGTATR